MAQVDSTTFNGLCVSCVLANSTFFYCQKDNTCKSAYVDNYSCEQGISTCLSYSTFDIPMKEIAPFTSVKSSFNYTLRGGYGVKFSISNQDSKVTSWFKLMLITALTDSTSQAALTTDTAVDTTNVGNISGQILTNVPSGVKIYYYDQNSMAISPDFVYSKTGRSFLHPLNTRFFYAYSNGSDVQIEVIYGNANLNQAFILSQGLLGVFMLIHLVM